MLRMLTVVGFALLIAGPASAGTLSWGLATDTAGAWNISTTGSLVKAFDSGGLGATVNGVAFAAGCEAGDDVCGAIGSAAFGQFDDGADLGDLDALLTTANFAAPPASASPTTVSLTGLVLGSQYQLQLFFMDQRGSSSSPPAGCVGCNDRLVTFSSGVGSVTLEADPGNEPNAPFGQYVVGAFTADSSTQAFDVTGAGFDQFGTPISLRQVNAWQLRAVPEPSSIVLLTLVGPFLMRQRGTVRT